MTGSSGGGVSTQIYLEIRDAYETLKDVQVTMGFGVRLMDMMELHLKNHKKFKLEFRHPAFQLFTISTFNYNN
jgi:hypothetical protein